MPGNHQKESNNGRTRREKARIAKRILIGVAAIAVLWGANLGISWIVETVTKPITNITDAVGGFVEGTAEIVDEAAGNAADTLERPTETRTWTLTQVEPVGDLEYSAIECASLARVSVNVTLVEVHGRAIFWTDSDTFSGAVPVKVRPCLYLDAVEASVDGSTIIVDLSKMHFEPDPEAVEFMIEYLKNPNPGNESGTEQLLESGWLPFGMLQGLFQDPERTEISGILIAIGESAAANSTCISEMLEGVKEHAIRFYEEQAARQGRNDVTVTVVGTPDIYQNDYLLDSLLDAATSPEVDIDVQFEDAANTCEITFDE